MRVKERVVDNVVVFQVSGARTNRDAGTVRADIDRALQNGFRHVVLDLAAVT